jgi:hypothetical protein
MRKDWLLTQEAFDAFLRWLSADRDEAAAKYEHIRRKLIKIFDFKGCDNSDLLADESINRVIERVFRAETSGEKFPTQFIYGVAKIIYLEYCSNPKTFILDEDTNLADSGITETEFFGDDDVQFCMKFCLESLKKADSELIFNYFSVNKKTKTTEREAICKKRGESMNALRVKISRIRQKLQKCRKNCLQEKK